MSRKGHTQRRLSPPPAIGCGLKSQPEPTCDWMASEVNAFKLAKMVEGYWKQRGYDGVQAWASWEGASTRWCVRSNLVDGVPPQKGFKAV